MRELKEQMVTFLHLAQRRLRANEARALQQGRGEEVEAQRLGDVLVDAQLDRLLKVAGLLEGRGNDDRRRWTDGADALGHLQTRHHRHADVGDHQIRLVLGKGIQPGLTVRRRMHHRHAPAQEHGQLLADVVLIFDVQHRQGAQMRLIVALGLMAHVGTCSASGVNTVNSAPVSRLPAQRRPPIPFSMIILDM